MFAPARNSALITVNRTAADRRYHHQCLLGFPGHRGGLWWLQGIRGARLVRHSLVCGTPANSGNDACAGLPPYFAAALHLKRRHPSFDIRALSVLTKMSVDVTSDICTPREMDDLKGTLMMLVRHTLKAKACAGSEHSASLWKRRGLSRLISTIISVLLPVAVTLMLGFLGGWHRDFALATPTVRLRTPEQ
jgi:hypothetical protein